MDKEKQLPAQEEGLKLALSPEQLEGILQGGVLRIEDRPASRTTRFKRYILNLQSMFSRRKTDENRS